MFYAADCLARPSSALMPARLPRFVNMLACGALQLPVTVRAISLDAGIAHIASQGANEDDNTSFFGT